MKVRIGSVLLFLLLCPVFVRAELTEQEMITRILERIQENDKIANGYGYHQEALVREMDEENKIEKEEKRLYRTTWLENEPYQLLLKVDGKELTSEQKSEESKRRSRFLKAVKEKKPQFKLEWQEIFSKYDYKILPGEDGAAYVMTFQPKNGKLPERNRGEKVLNHISGKLWLDSGFNLLKGHAQLVHDVKFGLGILGNLEALSIDYAQQMFGSKVWLPEQLKVAYTARIFVKSTRQHYESKFFDIYERP